MIVLPDRDDGDLEKIITTFVLMLCFTRGEETFHAVTLYYCQYNSIESTFNSRENLQLLVIIKADDWSCRRGSTDKIRRMGCNFDSAASEGEIGAK